MFPADHLLAIALVALGPIRSYTVGLRRLERAAPEALPATRRGVYGSAISIQWGLVALLAVIWILTGRAWDGLGLSFRLTSGLIGVALGLAVITVLLVRQRNQTL